MSLHLRTQSCVPRSEKVRKVGRRGARGGGRLTDGVVLGAAWLAPAALSTPISTPAPSPVSLNRTPCRSANFTSPGTWMSHSSSPPAAAAAPAAARRGSAFSSTMALMPAGTNSSGGS